MRGEVPGVCDAQACVEWEQRAVKKGKLGGVGYEERGGTSEAPSYASYAPGPSAPLLSAVSATCFGVFDRKAEEAEEDAALFTGRELYAPGLGVPAEREARSLARAWSRRARAEGETARAFERLRLERADAGGWRRGVRGKLGASQARGTRGRGAVGGGRA